MMMGQSASRKYQRRDIHQPGELRTVKSDFMELEGAEWIINS
jgi:hypothetical protein